MREPLNVVERDRRSLSVRNESLRVRDERNMLDRQLKRALDQRQRDWEAGFAAALDMVARGTRETVATPEDEPTAPYPIIDPTVIEAD